MLKICQLTPTIEAEINVIQRCNMIGFSSFACRTDSEVKGQALNRDIKWWPIITSHLIEVLTCMPCLIKSKLLHEITIYMYIRHSIDVFIMITCYTHYLINTSNYLCHAWIGAGNC